MVKQKKSKEEIPITLDDLVEHIALLHGTPSYVLLRIQPSLKVAILAAASNPKNLGLVLNTKQMDAPDYMG